ncbi:hypothetical protein [Variovorax paradoxus]|uniref:hypothetical protein n=1 Tax=Variovorax paradoxus TaxID=34073 RepID=UPI001933358A|nr:hypothetical protein INQ48_01525 [Variovorax paradoxus]
MNIPRSVTFVRLSLAALRGTGETRREPGGRGGPRCQGEAVGDGRNAMNPAPSPGGQCRRDGGPAFTPRIDARIRG